MPFAQIIRTNTTQGQTDFSFTFPFIKEEHIKLFVNFVEITQGTGSSEFQVITNVTPNVARLNTGLASANTRVEVRRVSSINTVLVDFEDGATLTAADLDRSALQSLFIAQELDDALKQGISIDASTGLPTLGSQKLTNVADPTNAQDVVTKAFLERAGSITTTQILDGTIVAGDIAAGAIVDSKINASAAIQGSKLQAASSSNAGAMSAADKTKLDTIESNAKDDQNASEIRTLVESATDSNVFTDADHTKLNNAVTLTDTQTLTNKTLTTPVINDLSGSAVVTSGTSTSDNKVYSAKRAGEIFYGKDTVEEIQSGETWSSADNKVATTAAIDARIIDLIDDVGGFDIIANEQSFPNTNPQGTTGQAAVISIKAVTTNLVPSGTTVTIANGNLANNQTITITGVTSTIPSGFGILVESTSTTHTYSFHRLVPKATEVTTVASKATEIGRLGTADAVADMAILGTADVVADMNTLGTADVVSDMNTLATTDVVNDMNTLATSSVLNNIDTVVTNVSNVNNVGSNIAKINSVAAVVGGTQTFTVTVQNVSGSNYFFIDGQQAPTLTLARGFTYTFDVSDSSNSGHPLRFKDGSGNSYTTGVTTNGTQGQSGATVVIAVAANAPSSLRYYCTVHGNGMGNTITVTDDNIGTVAGSIANVNTTAGAIANVNNVGNSISNVNTVASNISSVNSFFNTYRIGSSNPTSSLDVGDLFFNTSTNSLKVYTGSAWVDGVTTTGNFALKTGNTFTGNNIYNDNVKSIYGTGSDLQVFHHATDGSQILSSTVGLEIKDTGGFMRIRSNELKIQSTSNETYIEADANGSVQLFYDNVKKLETTSGGVLATGDVDSTTGIFERTNNGTSQLEFSSTNETKLKHLSNGQVKLSFIGVGNAARGSIDAQSGFIRMKTAADETGIICRDNSSTDLHFDDSKKFETQSTGVKVHGNIFMDDNDEIRLGDSGDFQLFHNSSTGEARIFNSNAGGINIITDLFKVKNNANNETLLNASNGGAVELYHDNSKKFETTSAGATVTGSLTATGFATNGGGVTLNGVNHNAAWVRSANTMRFNDNAIAGFGNSDDLKIFHNGENFIEGNNKKLIFRNTANNIHLQAVSGEGGIDVLPNSSVKLYFDNSKKFETTSTGVQVSGRYGFDANNFITCNTTANTMEFVTGGQQVGEFNSTAFTFLDNKRARFGSGNDLDIYHDGSNSHIDDTGTGYLILQTSGLRINNSNGSEGLIHADENGNVELHYDGSKKFETYSSGVYITGHCQPNGNNVYNLGSTTYRWANIYTNDLNLSNEGGANDVDGTWGSYTIQEGAEDLFLVNKRNGKKYKFNLTEVS